MNKKAYYLLLVFFISVRLIAQNNNTNLLVKEEASLKTLSFLNLIPEGKEKDYGFNSRSDFSKIKIEEPYQTYYVSDKNNKLTFISGNEWRVPLSIDGQYVALLSVQINQGKAEAVDFGGNILSQKIQEFEKLFPNEASQHVIIRNTYLKRDYITTNFSSLCNQNKGIDFMEINTNSSQPIYQLNELQPIKTSIAIFCDETMDLINNTNGYK
ncbi:MAG TPA: hypothetical protein VIK14_03390 [Ignavibacteria bacterium]